MWLGHIQEKTTWSIFRRVSEDGVSIPLRAESYFVSFYKAPTHSSSQIKAWEVHILEKKNEFFLDRWTARQEVIDLQVASRAEWGGLETTMSLAPKEKATEDLNPLPLIDVLILFLPFKRPCNRNTFRDVLFWPPLINEEHYMCIFTWILQ